MPLYRPPAPAAFLQSEPHTAEPLVEKLCHLCHAAFVEQAELNAAEYDRMTALLKESTRLEQEYHRQLMDFMKQYEQQQRTRLNSLLDAFAYLADDDTNYERAVYAILNYADQTGLALQHGDFDAFRAAMCSEEEFVLR